MHRFPPTRRAVAALVLLLAVAAPTAVAAADAAPTAPAPTSSPQPSVAASTRPEVVIGEAVAVEREAPGAPSSTVSLPVQPR